MRPDVKLGIFVSMVVVTVMGSYYLYRGSREKPIPVGALSSNNLAERTKAPTLKSNKKTANARKPANAKRQSPVRTRQAAKPSRQPNDPRNAAATPIRRNAAGASPTSTTSNPTKQRLTQRPRSSTPTSILPSTTQPSQAAKPKPIATRSMTRNNAASNRQSQRPTAGSPFAGKAARKPVSLVATQKTAGHAAIETHRVLPGETLASISQMYYGSTQQAKLLLKANSSVADPRSLRVGMLIKIPAQDIEQATDRASKKTALIATAKKTAGKSYTVRSGDSLFVIAKRELGSGPRWKEIFELNKKALGNNPNRLKVGQSLSMPAS